MDGRSHAVKRSVEFDLLGCPVSDYASGEIIGWVKCVVYDRPPDLIARIGIERGAVPSIPPTADPLDATETTEPKPEHDYMIGQISAVTLSEPNGHPIVRVGEPISASVLEAARRHGVLHRLEATFHPEGA